MKLTFDNFIGIYDDAYTSEYCKQVIEYVDKFEESGLGVNRQQQVPGMPKPEKDDLQIYTAENIVYLPMDINYSLGKHFLEPLTGYLKTYFEQYGVLDQAPPLHVFSTKLQKTRVGQGYHVWHCEDLDRIYQNRVLAWMMYLNTVDEGGETEFLYFPKRIKPIEGRLIIWPAGFTHTHRGNPPLSNTKYVVTGWVEL